MAWATSLTSLFSGIVMLYLAGQSFHAAKNGAACIFSNALPNQFIILTIIGLLTTATGVIGIATSIHQD